VLDIDECTDGTHKCDVKGAVCNNIRGSYNCTCKDGFYGDGINCTGLFIYLFNISLYTVKNHQVILIFKINTNKLLINSPC